MYTDMEKMEMRDKYMKAMTEKGVPIYQAQDITRYILEGAVQGSFIMALFSNDLQGAFRAADGSNTKLMPVYADLLFCDFPADCSGSPEAVKKWVLDGGLCRSKRS